MTREDMSEIKKKEAKKKEIQSKHVCGIYFWTVEWKKRALKSVTQMWNSLFIILLSTFLCIFHVSLSIVTACLPAVQSVIFQSTTRLYIFNLCDCNCFPRFQPNANCACECVCCSQALCSTLLSCDANTPGNHSYYTAIYLWILIADCFCN